MSETVRLEEFTGFIQNKLICVWQDPVSPAAWLPTEFLLSQYITRVLVVGRLSPLSAGLASDSSWTQIWRSPGTKEWSCLLNVLQHMPGPIMLVIGSDLALSPKLISLLRCTSADATVLVLRQPGIAGAGWNGDPPDQVFFPVLTPTGNHELLASLNEWTLRTAPKHLDAKTLLPQLAAQQYGLTASDGTWMWYCPADSPGLVTQTVPQIARQIQLLGAMLATM